VYGETQTCMLVQTNFSLEQQQQNTMEVNGARQLFGYLYSSKYLILYSAKKRNSYRFGTTWKFNV